VSFVAWHRPLKDRPRRYLLVSVGTIFRTDICFLIDASSLDDVDASMGIINFLLFSLISLKTQVLTDLVVWSSLAPSVVVLYSD
jgi:hypothetical protein